MARKLAPALIAALLLFAGVHLAAAQQAKAEKKAKPTPKVWTNDDIEALKRGTITVLGTEGAPAEAAPTGEAAAGTAEAKAAGAAADETPKEQTEEYWQKQLQPLREELAKIDDQIQNFQSNQGQANNNAISITAGSSGVQVQDALQRLQQRRQGIQQKISDIQDDARRAGVPPAWAR